MPSSGVKGNSGGKPGRSGRKRKADEIELEQLLDRGWPKKKRLEMIKAWSERAARGDLEAGKILMAYKFGKPKERTDITSNGETIKQIDTIVDVKPHGA